MKDIITPLMNAIKKKLESKSRGGYGEILHASDIINFCPRRIYLYRNKNIKTPIEDIPKPLALTYLIGKKIEEMVIENHPNVVGINRCLRCNDVTVGVRPKRCDRCGCEDITYFVPNLIYEVGKFLIIGNIDAILKEKGTNKILEIKSIDKDAFDELEEPSVTYTYQVKSYLWLISKLKKKDVVKNFNLSPEVGYIMYVSKGHRQMPIKTFEIELDRKFKTYMNRLVKQIKELLTTEKPPERLCSTQHHLLAKKCNIRDLCFRG